MLLNLVAKNKILPTIIYHYMTSYGNIIMIIIDSCMFSFHFDCIMQLKKSYHIATNVCGRKSATTFGDLPDCYNGIDFKPIQALHCHTKASGGWYHKQAV